MGRKDKGRKGDKGKGRKHDRAMREAVAEGGASNAASKSRPAAGTRAEISLETAPKLPSAPKATRTAPKPAPEVHASRASRSTIAAPKIRATRTRTQRVATSRLAKPKVDAAKVQSPPLPADRASLLALHQAARRRRDGAPLLSKERAAASFEIEQIEVHIARVERAMDPPLV